MIDNKKFQISMLSTLKEMLEICERLSVVFGKYTDEKGKALIGLLKMSDLMTTIDQRLYSAWYDIDFSNIIETNRALLDLESCTRQAMDVITKTLSVPISPHQTIEAVEQMEKDSIKIEAGKKELKLLSLRIEEIKRNMSS
jgi:hypothetical protein